MNVSKNVCFGVLASDAFWQVNKKLARHFKDNNTAILLADLISRDRYWGDRTDEYDGWFFVSQSDLEEDCNISRKVQSRIVNDLVAGGILEVERRGVPCRNYYQLNYKAIVQILEADENLNGKSSNDKKAQPVVTSGDSQLLPEGATRNDLREQLYNKNNIIKIDNKNKNNKRDVKEVVTRHNWSDVEEIFVYWVKVMGKGKAVLSDKRKQLILKRLDDGYTTDDLRAAIDGCKQSEWHQGKNDRDTKYDSLELILRDSEKVEAFISMAGKQDTHGWASEAMQNYSRELNKRQKEEVTNGFEGSTRLAGYGQKQLARGDM